MNKLIMYIVSIVAVTFAAVDLEVTPSNWTGIEFGNESGTIVLTNNTSKQMQIDGIRAAFPNAKLAEISGQGSFDSIKIVDDGSAEKKFDALIGDMNGGSANDNLPENILNPGKKQTYTYSTTSVGKDLSWTPKDKQVLIIGSKSLAEKKVWKDISGITLKQLDSLWKTPEFYDSTLFQLDTLGIHGSKWGAGFIDTWFDQEKEIPYWQIQVCEIPVEDCTVSPIDTFTSWTEPKAFIPDSLDVDDPNYGHTKRPFYMMGLAMSQEYMNIDMQSLMSKGFQESNAGLCMYESRTVPGYTDTLYDSVTYKDGDMYKSGQTVDGWLSTKEHKGSDTLIIYVTTKWVNGYQKLFHKYVKYTNRSANVENGMGPMHYEEATYRDKIFTAYPKFFPYEGGVDPGSRKWIDAPTGGAPLNSPAISNAYLISSLYMWYTWQLIVATLGQEGLDKMKDASDRHLMNHAINYAWNAGTDGDFRQRFMSESFKDFIYIQQINNGVEHLQDANRRSTLNGGDRKCYDAPIDKATFEEFFFGEGGNGSNGSLGKSGILHHFKLDEDERKLLWTEVDSAFNMLKGKAPSTKGTDFVSYRYDYLAILRIAKKFLDLSLPVPKTEIFKNWISITDEVPVDRIAPFLAQKNKGVGESVNGVFHKEFIVTDSANIQDSAGIRSVEWTLDSEWSKWYDAQKIDDSTFDIEADQKWLNGEIPAADDTVMAWVRVTDINDNSLIDTFLVWKNLDTVEVIPPTADSSIALDVDGDGNADKIELWFGKNVSYDLSTIEKLKWSWPDKSSLTDAATVAYSKKVVTISDGSISGGGGTGLITFDFKERRDNEIDVLDRVGPVLKTATRPNYADASAKDTLLLEVSEDLHADVVNGTAKFRIFNGSKKDIESNTVSLSGKSLTVVFDRGTVAEGDSINISTTGSVKDAFSNAASDNNVKIPINIIGEKNPVFTSAKLFDENGDGVPDSLVCALKLGTDKDLKTAYDLKDFTFSWPDGSSDISSFDVKIIDDVTILIHNFANLQPWGTGEVTAKVSDDKTISVTVEDKTGPVLNTAIRQKYSDGSAKDTLVMEVSDKLHSDVTNGTARFVLYSDTDGEISSDEVSLNGMILTAVFDRGTFSLGDSIIINTVGSVKDNVSNAANGNNRKIPVTILGEKNPSFASAKLYDENGDGIPDSLVCIIVKGLDTSKSAHDLSDFTFRWPDGSSDVTGFNVTVVDDKTILITDFKNLQPWGTGEVTAKVDDKTISVAIEDKTGPVLHAATRQKYSDGSAKDTLVMEVSDKLHADVTNNTAQFVLIRTGEVDISSNEVSLNGMILTAVFNRGTFVEGDSLMISTSGSVMDNVSNSASSNNQKVPVTILGEKNPTFTSAKLYDENGDGVPDSLVCTIALGSDKNAYTTADLKDMSFSWPDKSSDVATFTKTVVDETTLLITGFKAMQPWGTGEVSAKLPNDSKITVTIEDKVGPVIDSAFMWERSDASSEDTLCVYFSENLADNFDDYTKSLAQVSKELDALTCTAYKDKRSALFTYKKGAITPEDSVFIKLSTTLSDESGNRTHKNNPKREIRILNRPLQLKDEGAALYDTDADGRLDFIRLYFEKELTEDRLKNSTFEFTWGNDKGDSEKRVIDHSDFDISASDARIIEITLDDLDSYQKGVTSIGDNSFYFYQDDALNNTVDTQNIITIDSMAPVIVNAIYRGSYVDSDTMSVIDTIELTFSEDIRKLSKDDIAPFTCYDVDESERYAPTILSSHSGRSVKYPIRVNSASKIPQVGDSIWISTDEPVTDEQGNVQENDDNQGALFSQCIYVPNYKVGIFPNPYNLDTIGVNPVLEHYTDNALTEEGVIAFVVGAFANRPIGELKGYISMFDVLGNVIFRQEEMSFQSNKGVLTYHTPVVNGTNRQLGKGTYLVEMEIIDEHGERVKKSLMVGVMGNYLKGNKSEEESE